MPFLVLIFCGAAMTACDDGDKDKDEAEQEMPSVQDYGGGS